MKDSVVRVGISNNFNCTAAEFRQLSGFTVVRENSHFFVNSNIKTENLLDINNHDYKAVITVNPDITVNRSLVKKLYKVDKEKISFVRVKYIPNDKAIKELITELSEKGYNVVITVMRFKSNKTVKLHSEKDLYNYQWSWFRLEGRLLSLVGKFADSLDNVYICDRNGLGCQACGLCSKLTVGKYLELFSLNLSTSGICKFDCVDCYAKKMQHTLKCFGKNPINFDSIKKNMKQCGKTAHIKSKKKALV